MLCDVLRTQAKTSHLLWGNFCADGIDMQYKPSNKARSFRKWVGRKVGVAL
jgi:hypothetical protein